MNQLIQAIRSEQLKQKRTLALRLAFIAPLAIIVLQFYLLYQNGLTYLEGDQSPWVYWTRQTLQFWALLMAPLFITLETALVAQLDHKQQCWKQLFVLPISRWAIYGAKIIASLAFLALSTLTLLAGILVGGSICPLKAGFGIQRFNSVGRCTKPARDCVYWLLPDYCSAFLDSPVLVQLCHSSWYRHRHDRSRYICYQFRFSQLLSVGLIRAGSEQLCQRSISAHAITAIRSGRRCHPSGWRMAVFTTGCIVTTQFHTRCRSLITNNKKGPDVRAL
ncbi:MAG: ABC transporter permease [Chloroflexota bacterium]